MGWAALVGYKVLEALNSENRLEVCKMQHTTGHQARSFRKCILHHLTSFERDEQRSSVKKVSKLWILRTSTQVVIKQALLETASYTTFLKFANSNTQLVIKQDLSESLSHHLLRSFERDEQHSSVQKFPMLWILRTFLDHCKMQYKPVIKQDLVEV